jgi:hypothetical protein
LKLLQAAADLYATVSRAFIQEPDYSRTTANERERYTPSLIAVGQFFCALGDRRLGDRFFELASAISDLNAGTLHPFLQPVAAQRTVLKAIQDVEAEAQARRTGGVENRKFSRDANEMTDEELMAIFRQAPNDQAGKED